jgi:hypothetical protein
MLKALAVSGGSHKVIGQLTRTNKLIKSSVHLRVTFYKRLAGEILRLLIIVNFSIRLVIFYRSYALLERLSNRLKRLKVINLSVEEAMDLMSVRKLSGAERIYLCKVKVAEVGLVLLIFVLKNWDIVFKQITFIILVALHFSLAPVAL